MKLKIVEVRGSFLNLFEPKQWNEGEPRYSGVFSIEPGSANARILTAGLIDVAKEKWGNKAEAVLKDLKAKGRVAYKEEPLSKDGEVYEGFEGMYTLKASSKARPLVVDRDKTPLSAADGRPYSGSYVLQ